MPNSRGMQGLVRSHRALIHKHAIGAAAFAMATAAIPPGVGAAADLLGLDFVGPMQRRMLLKICDRAGADSGVVLATLGQASRHRTRKIRPEGMAATAMSAAAQRLISRGLGLSAARLVPIAGATVSASLAYYETLTIGHRCLELICSKQGEE